MRVASALAVTLLLCSSLSFGSRFLPPATYGVPGHPLEVALADLNHDGKLDAVVTSFVYINGGNAVTGLVTVLLGNGDGTFKAGLTTPAGRNLGNGLAVADFDSDGNLDVAASGGAGVVVLLGKGDGTFKSHNEFPGGDGGNAVIVGDFNADGAPDLAASNQFQGTVSVLLGNGDGTFQSPTTYTAGGANSIISLAVGDFNQDSHLDLLCVSISGGILVLPGKGDGTLGTAIGTNSPMSLVAVTDLNGDGKLDLVTGNRSGSVATSSGNGDGTFTQLQSTRTPAEVAALALGDFDHDGNTDFVFTEILSRRLGVEVNNGDGTFHLGEVLDQTDTTGINSAAAGDLNGDGASEIVIIDSNHGTVLVYVNRGRRIGKVAADTSVRPTSPFSD